MLRKVNSYVHHSYSPPEADKSGEPGFAEVSIIYNGSIQQGTVSHPCLLTTVHVHMYITYTKCMQLVKEEYCVKVRTYINTMYMYSGPSVMWLPSEPAPNIIGYWTFVSSAPSLLTSTREVHVGIHRLLLL